MLSRDFSKVTVNLSGVTADYQPDAEMPTDELVLRHIAEGNRKAGGAVSFTQGYLAERMKAAGKPGSLRYIGGIIRRLENDGRLRKWRDGNVWWYQVTEDVEAEAPVTIAAISALPKPRTEKAPAKPSSQAVPKQCLSSAEAVPKQCLSSAEAVPKQPDFEHESPSPRARAPAGRLLSLKTESRPAGDREVRDPPAKPAPSPDPPAARRSREVCINCADGFPDLCLWTDRYGQRTPGGCSGFAYAAGPTPKCTLHLAKLQKSSWPSLMAFEGVDFYHCPSQRDGSRCSALWASDVGWVATPGQAELRRQAAAARYQEQLSKRG